MSVHLMSSLLIVCVRFKKKTGRAGRQSALSVLLLYKHDLVCVCVHTHSVCRSTCVS